MGLLTVSVMLAVVLLTDQVRGDACSDLTLDCIHNVTEASGKMVDIVTDDVTNLTAIVAQCQTVQAQIASCEQELPQVCPASFSGTIQSLQQSYDSMCGPDQMCNLQLSECQLRPAYYNNITEALLKSPPDGAVVEEMCSQLNASVGQCAATLRADCSHLPEIAPSIDAIVSGFQHLCGKEAQCQTQMGKCHPLISNISSARGNLHEMCRLAQAAEDCLHSALDPECLTLPEIKSTVAFASPAMCSDEAMKCPQIFQCLGGRDDGEDGPGSSDLCTLTGNVVGCVADLRDTCQLKEEPMTFSELGKLSQDFCIEIKKARGIDTCSQLGQCVLRSEFMRRMAGIFADSSSSPSTPQIPDVSFLMDASVWTKYLEEVSGCIVSSAAACQLDHSLVAYMADQNAYLNAKLSSSSHRLTPRDSTLLLLVAVFTAWAHSFL